MSQTCFYPICNDVKSDKNSQNMTANLLYSGTTTSQQSKKNMSQIEVIQWWYRYGKPLLTYSYSGKKLICIWLNITGLIDNATDDLKYRTEMLLIHCLLFSELALSKCELSNFLAKAKVLAFATFFGCIIMYNIANMF